MNFNKSPHKCNFYGKINPIKSKEKGGNKLKKLNKKFGGILASLALMVTTMNVNSTCIFYIHQPKLPKEAERLRKF